MSGSLLPKVLIATGLLLFLLLWMWRLIRRTLEESVLAGMQQDPHHHPQIHRRPPTDGGLSPFRVHGIQQRTNTVVDWYCNARNEADAHSKGESEGIQVERIEPG